MNRRALTRNLLAPCLSLVLIVLIWDAIVVWGHVASYIAPTPWSAFRAVVDDWGTVWPLTWMTITETVYGFVIGALLGFLLGVALGKMPLVQRLVYPVLILTQAVPIVALAPPIVLIFGFALVPKVIIVAWIVFFPVTVSVIGGLSNVDGDLLTLAKVFGANRWRTFWNIEIPSIATPLFSGLKIGATYAVTGAIIAEGAASTGDSLARYQQTANADFHIAAVYGTTVVMTIIGIAWFLLVVGIEYVATPWRHRSTARSWWRGN